MNPEIDFTIRRLGQTRHRSPLTGVRFVRDDKQILYDIEYDSYKSRDLQAGPADLATLELAGPRQRLYFDPQKLTAGIVTCGGLCPGINNVIRSLFMQLHLQYGVPVILGFRYGFRGILKDSKPGPRTLTIQDVEPIHNLGGSILSSSRGSSDPAEIVDGLGHHGVDLLFTIGGDGTIRASIDIETEITRRGLDITVINIPKTIDNDIPFTSKSFGFQTAFSEAVESIRCAHTEAQGTPNGIGIVKLMGRKSGFIAALATLAQEDVNYLLVPETDFDLDGPAGLLAVLEPRLEQSKHALIVVAEGAGQKFFDPAEPQRDASGNVLLDDIGLYLKSRIKEHFQSRQIEVNVKYIDPSYIIRSVPAIPEDAVYCGILAEHAVHAALSGRTQMVIGRWNSRFVHLPMDIIKAGRKEIDPQGALWQSILLSTGQPPLKN